jgi:hypothetical protein
MLSLYGFSDKEKADFIEYWKEKLDKNTDYAFYPQTSKQLDKIMPLFITPAPQKVFRIWFYIKPLTSSGVKPVGQIVKFGREGYYAVEWGGIFR